MTYSLKQEMVLFYQSKSLFRTNTKQGKLYNQHKLIKNRIICDLTKFDNDRTMIAQKMQSEINIQNHQQSGTGQRPRNP